MDFVVIIPARLASTRLPNKVLHAIAGEPIGTTHADTFRCAADETS